MPLPGKNLNGKFDGLRNIPLAVTRPTSEEKLVLCLDIVNTIVPGLNKEPVCSCISTFLSSFFCYTACFI